MRDKGNDHLILSTGSTASSASGNHASLNTGAGRCLPWIVLQAPFQESAYGPWSCIFPSPFSLL